jgi:hypothetical protein
MADNFIPILLTSFIVDKPDTEASDVIASAHKQKDLMYVKFELCHANVNRNKDEFLPEDLKSAYQTAVAKPITWEHTNEIIGHIYESEYVEAPTQASSDVDTNTDKIVCSGVIYKYRFPTRAREMKSRFEEDKAFFSMETYFEKAECSECGEQFHPDGPYCEHLKNRFNGNSKASRRLRTPHFAGAGSVKRPADDAKMLTIASHKTFDIPLIEMLGTRFTVAEYIEFMDLVMTSDAAYYIRKNMND